MHYDVEVPGSLGVFARRYWCPVDAPVIGADGRIALIAECVEEISDKVQRFVGGLAADAVHEEPGYRPARKSRRDALALFGLQVGGPNTWLPANSASATAGGR